MRPCLPSAFELWDPCSLTVQPGAPLALVSGRLVSSAVAGQSHRSEPSPCSITCQEAVRGRGRRPPPLTAHGCTWLKGSPKPASAVLWVDGFGREWQGCRQGASLQNRVQQCRWSGAAERKAEPGRPDRGSRRGRGDTAPPGWLRCSSCFRS